MKKKLSAGKQFEADFVSSLSPLLTCIRLNDSREGLVHQRNPADFLVYNAQRLYFVELKSSLGRSMSIGDTKSHTIKHHQIDLVMEEGNKPNCKGIFILNFREHKETYMIFANVIYYLYKHMEKKSISLDYCKENGWLVPEEGNKYNLSFFNPQVF